MSLPTGGIGKVSCKFSVADAGKTEWKTEMLWIPLGRDQGCCYRDQSPPEQVLLALMSIVLATHSSARSVIAFKGQNTKFD